MSDKPDKLNIDKWCDEHSQAKYKNALGQFTCPFCELGGDPLADIGADLAHLDEEERKVAAVLSKLLQENPEVFV